MTAAVPPSSSWLSAAQFWDVTTSARALSFCEYLDTARVFAAAT
jgi:hypothetical protein